MKKLSSFLVLFLFAITHVKAQTVYPMYSNYINCGSESDQLKNLAQNELYIVKIGMKELDDALQSSVEKYWKQSKGFKVIDASEVNGLLKDKNHYFIAPVHYGFSGMLFISDQKNNGYDNITVFNGDGKTLYHDMVIASLPIFGDGKSTMHMVLKALNDGVDYVIKNNLEGRKKALFGLLTESKKNCSILKTKTLLINQIDAGKVKDMEKYHYKCEVKSGDEITKLITSGDKKYCVFSTGSNSEVAAKSIYIYDIESGNMVYGNFTMSSQALYAADYIRLNDAIEGKLDK